MRNSIFILFLLPLTSLAQTITLPTWVADSLIFEVKVSRQCIRTVDTLQKEIKKLGSELVANGDAIKLQHKESSTLQELLLNSEAGRKIDQMQNDLDKKKLKQKVKNRNLVIIGETILTVVILLL